jgi:putative restriction endonuclease
MSLDAITDPISVSLAIGEFDEIGRDAFLVKYGFGRARQYFLVVGGRNYDSKAILGAAHGYQFPHEGPLKNSDFSGGDATVARKLEKLGYLVARSPDSLSKDSKTLSTSLAAGAIYTRKDLLDLLGSTDSTINNGIFRPKGFSSVLIFITKNKTSDRTQYLDSLAEGILRFQGQTKGRTDHLIRDHIAHGLELLVFYRDRKDEYPAGGFRYEGQFDYESHHGKEPTNFVLKHKGQSELESIRRELDDLGEFDPESSEDARLRTWGAIVRRQGQKKFRLELIEAYEGGCAITRCSVLDLLEAAHITPYQGIHTNHISNGLLLRTDLHTLFDLGMIAFDEELRVVILNEMLRSTEYGKLEGKPIFLPSDVLLHPSSKSVVAHRLWAEKSQK